jgi:1,4-dihydroxy-2-naphthoate polyprenyltransferase
MRPWSFPASVIPIFLGTMLALADGFFNPFFFITTLVGGVLIHAGTNLFNDYFDYQNGVDNYYSYGSSKVLTEGLMSPRQIFKGGLITSSLVMIIGLFLFTVRGPVILILGVVGLFTGYFYTARPIAFKYRGVGVPVVFFMMGPSMVIGSYFVQAANINWGVLWASLPVGCLVAAILYANEYRDVNHDSLHGITNLSIIFGREKARFIYYTLITSAYILVVVMVLGDLMSTWALLTLLTLPVALRPMRVMEAVSHGKDSLQLPIIDVLTARLHLQFGLLFIFGIALDFFF